MCQLVCGQYIHVVRHICLLPSRGGTCVSLEMCWAYIIRSINRSCGFKLHDGYFPYFIKVLLHPHAVSRRIICQDMNWLSWLGIKAQWLEMEISRAVGMILFIKGPSDDLRPSKTGRGETGKDNHHHRKLMTSVAETERETSDRPSFITKWRGTARTAGSSLLCVEPCQWLYGGRRE
jgi:hypothetical protein